MDNLEQFLDELRPLIEAATVKVFADVPFIDVTPAPDLDNIQLEKTQQNKIRVNIIEPFPGTVRIYLPDEVKTKIAENIYASEMHQIDIDSVDDCLLEMLNIITGDFLHKHCSNIVIYKIGFPEYYIQEEENPEYKTVDIPFQAEGFSFLIKTSIGRIVC